MPGLAYGPLVMFRSAHPDVQVALENRVSPQSVGAARELVYLGIAREKSVRDLAGWRLPR